MLYKIEIICFIKRDIISRIAAKNINILMLLLVVLFSVDSIAQNSNEFVRKSIFNLSSLEVEMYRNVVTTMKALPDSDPRSWRYQAAMHQFITTDDIGRLPSDRFSREDKEEMMSYAVNVVPHAEEHNTWGQCHRNDEIFLLWHRIYLYYFERIARKISNQPNFSLPYWDYTKGANGDTLPRRLPESFRLPTYRVNDNTSPKANPLYVTRRESINNGGLLDTIIVALNALQAKSYSSFNLSLMNTPHNAIHSALGKQNSLLMGATVWAAQDPIFWLHHANIDRLWHCWEQRNESGPHGEDSNYTFIDEDGNPVLLTLKQMKEIASNIDYVYEEYDECNQGLASNFSTITLSNKVKIIAFSTDSINHENKLDTAIILSSVPKIVKVQMSPLAKEVITSDAFTDNIETYSVSLQIQNIRSELPVNIVYKVNIRPKSTHGNGVTVGVIGFFGKGEQLFHNQNKQHDHNSSNSTVSMDITNVLLNSKTFANRDINEFEVILIPSTGVEGESVSDLSNEINISRPQIGKINIVIEN